MRLFLAIKIEDAILQALAGGIDRLRETRAAVRWVGPEGIHLTIRFLGETDPDRVKGLVEKISGVSSMLHPFPISVAGTGAFPSPARPRVIWAGVEEPSGTLNRLWALMEKAVTDLGWERERKGFSPHVTLGRVKGPINLSRLSSVIQTMKDDDWGRQEVRTLALIRSRLEGGGPRYEDIKVFPLGRRSEPAKPDR